MKWKQVDNTKVVKARLTARGFKDRQQDYDTFSATCTRFGARAVNGFAAQRKMRLWSLDVSAAFLKDLTFEEIKSMPNGSIRSVQLEIDGPTATVL
eukprot:10677662-Karenia_brevis.AAC.1